jgi:transcriptional regulator with XRE-family HTH domain
MRGRIPTTELGRKRIAAGLTRSEIAQRAGCSISSITYFEQHPEVNPTGKCKALAKIYEAMTPAEPERRLRTWLERQVETFIREHEQAGPGGRAVISRSDICDLGMLLIRARRYQLAYGQELNPAAGHRGKE